MVQSAVLINIFFMLVDLAFNLKILLAECREEHKWPTMEQILKPGLDISVAAMVIAYCSIKIPHIWESAMVTEDIQGRLSRIDWENKELAVTEKKRVFFNEAKLLTALLQEDGTYSAFANVILILNLLRIIQCTSVHPRLALLTSTIQKALDDLWHAALLIILLTTSFAAIGTWQFGGFRDDFGTLTTTMQTQFEMMFGEFPRNWTQSLGLQTYTVFYFLVIFLLAQNFLLAIIVETYMGVRQDNEDLETEMEFTHDVLSSYLSYLRIWTYGWPSQRKLGKTIDKWTSRHSVGFLDLRRTGLFRDDVAVGRFIRHYGKYDFTSVTKIEHFPPSKSGEEVVDKIERRMAIMFGRAPLTLKQLAVQAMNKASDRKLQKEAEPQEKSCNTGEISSVPASNGVPTSTKDKARTISPEFDRVASAVNTNGYSGVGVDDLWRENQDLRAEVRSLKQMFQQVLQGQQNQTAQIKQLSNQLQSANREDDLVSRRSIGLSNIREGSITAASLVFTNTEELSNGVNGGTQQQVLRVFDSKPPAIMFDTKQDTSEKLAPLARRSLSTLMGPGKHEELR